MGELAHDFTVPDCRKQPLDSQVAGPIPPPGSPGLRRAWNRQVSA
jgi:hypothetical protein